MHVGVLPVCMLYTTYMPGTQGGRRGCKIWELGVTGGCVPLSGCRELSLGTLEKQQGLLTTE